MLLSIRFMCFSWIDILFGSWTMIVTRVVIYSELPNPDCAEDVRQGGRAADGAEPGGRGDPFLLHAQQLRRLRSWRGHNVSSTLAFDLSATILGITLQLSKIEPSNCTSVLCDSCFTCIILILKAHFSRISPSLRAN